MKKLLLISYYWPPAGGGGVQRWLKMSKYIHQFGWELVVVTPHKTDGTITDTSLEKEIRPEIEVLRTDIWEPYDLFKKFTGKKKDAKVYSGFIDENAKPSLTKKISVFIRGNFFIPDARKFWEKPAVQTIENYLKTNTVDAVVSTGPPHTTHLIALKIKEKYNYPWIADFRDPWTNIDFYHQLQLSSWADKKHKKLEKKVLKNADKVVTVSWAWADDFVSISGRKDIQVITNGYDHQDFENEQVNLDKHFSITHIGSMNADRNPHTLWKVLADLAQENSAFKKDLKIKLYGSVDFSILSDIDKNGLKQNLEKIDFMPHQEVVKKMQESQILLLPINDTPNVKGVLPGKLYEYIGSKRPILGIGPDYVDAYKILSETNAGKMFDYKEYNALKAQILEWYSAFKSENLTVASSAYEKYQRKALAKNYTELLNSIMQ